MFVCLIIFALFSDYDFLVIYTLKDIIIKTPGKRTSGVFGLYAIRSISVTFTVNNKPVKSHVQDRLRSILSRLFKHYLTIYREQGYLYFARNNNSTERMFAAARSGPQSVIIRHKYGAKAR